MEIRAYYEDYLIYAQRNMGDMLDFAVNTCGEHIDVFFEKFIATGVAEQFGKGNPRYVAGKTGCEIAREIFEQCDNPIDDIEDVMYVEKTPEYWAGWILCYYQWFTGRSFAEIYRSVTLEQILNMYPTLHEADVTKFINIMEEKLVKKFPETNLKRVRTSAGLSQSELAELSGVSIRQIQLFEQRERDINKTQAQTLLKLSKALSCNMEQLLEN